MKGILAAQQRSKKPQIEEKKTRNPKNHAEEGKHTFLPSRIPQRQLDVLPIDLDVRDVVLKDSRDVDLSYPNPIHPSVQSFHSFMTSITFACVYVYVAGVGRLG